MSRPQKYAVVLTVILSALDGFDLLSMTFVAPALSRAFQIDSGALGLLLAASPVGALAGSILLAPFADVIGRRPLVLISLAIMTGGMLLTTLCTSIVLLGIVRVLTGIGVGAMVVVINPIAVEVTNQRARSFAISLMTAGYPLGGAFGGVVAAFLLHHFDWRAVFLLAAVISALVVPLVVRHIPESLTFLLDRRNDASLTRVNALLERFGHPPLEALPPTQTRQRTPYREIFRGTQLATTLQVSVISLLVFLTIYFFLSWQPTILVGLGFGVSTAATVSGASSFAGAFVCAVVGLLSRRIDGRILTVVPVLGLGIFVIAFGCVPASPVAVVALALLAGSCVPAATASLYVTSASAFAPHIRATGTGFIIGVGRVGSTLGPSIAGGLFALGGGRAGVSAALGACAILAGVLLIPLLRRRSRAA